MTGCMTINMQQGEGLTITDRTGTAPFGVDIEPTIGAPQRTTSSAPTPGPHTTYPMEP